MIYQKLNETDIATLRAAILTPAGERFLDYIESKNSDAYDPSILHAHSYDAQTIAFKAAYNQGYLDSIKCIIDILTPNQPSNNDMMNTSFQSPNDERSI